VVNSNRGDNVTIIPLPEMPYVFDFTYYRCVSGDRLDALAYSHYGDSTWWWKIARANPEVLDWTYLEPGRIIRIPAL
jgi:phage tail protein X